MNIVECVLASLRVQACGAERVPFGALTEEELRAVYALSKAQDLAHLVGAELMKQGALEPQSEIGGKFRKQQMIALLRYERIQYELEQICGVLERHQIPHMPLKGSVLRQYYPEPWMRTSADIDILVAPAQVNEAAELLVQELQYRNDGEKDHDIQMFSPSGVHLELHFETVERHCAVNANAVLQGIWDYAIPVTDGGYRRTTRDEMFYFYHIAHMAKHFEIGGCGIRFFLDLWMLCHRVDFDREKREALLREGGLLTFAQAAEALTEVWFSGAAHTDITEQMERYIVSGGVYGSSENSIAAKQARTGGNLGYARYLLFRPYSELKRQYPVLLRHKWLYPLCQLHRWIKLIFNGGILRAKRILTRSSQIAQTRADPVESMLRTLELTK